jgi:hypothetical protein
MSATEHKIRTNIARSSAAKKARRNWAQAQRARAVAGATHVIKSGDSVGGNAPVNLDFTDQSAQ